MLPIQSIHSCSSYIIMCEYVLFTRIKIIVIIARVQRTCEKLKIYFMYILLKYYLNICTYGFGDVLSR